MSHEIEHKSYCKYCKGLAEDCTCSRGSRLLSEQEILKIIGEGGWNRAMVWDIAIAQDAKSIAARDKWWIEQIDDYFETGLSRGVFEDWQSLKQSLEVKQ